MKHTISLSFTLLIFWLLNSGHYTFLLLVLSFISVVFVVYIAHRMDVVDHEAQPVHLTAKMPSYYLWLIKEIILSNFEVLKSVWGLKPLSPQFFSIEAKQKTDMGKVIYANSITLTPGTVSVDLKGSTITVHSLTKEAMDALLTDEMGDKVLELEQ